MVNRIGQLFAIVILLVAVPGEAATYSVDPGSSTIAFRIRHAVGFDSGFVQEFSGEIDISKKIELKGLSVSADMTSVTTMNRDRDILVHSPDFFDSAGHPQAQIKSRKIEDGFLTATVTIKGVKQDILFYYQLLGLSQNERGEEIAVVTMQGSFNRKDFGLEYASLTAEGNENIGEAVDLLIKIEATKR